MSWYGNLEGVGELSEEDKEFIKTETSELAPNILTIGLIGLGFGIVWYNQETILKILGR